ncbi:MAG TPA: hypothetical protein VF403_10565 [Kofleriaceae bacterium]
MHRLMCVALMVAAACSSSPKSAQTTPSNASTADGPTCDAVSGHVIDLLVKTSPDAPPDVVKKIHDTLQRHCTDDGWTAASRSCFANMSAKQDGDKCEDGLTEAQKKSLAVETVGDEPSKDNNTVTKPAGDPKSTGTRGTPKKGGDPCDGGE